MAHTPKVQLGPGQSVNCNSQDWRDKGVFQTPIVATGLSRVYLIAIQFFNHQKK